MLKKDVSKTMLTVLMKLIAALLMGLKSKAMNHGATNLPLERGPVGNKLGHSIPQKDHH